MMKVSIGPYKRWFGPYQLVDILKYLGVSEDTRDKIVEYIPAAPFLFIEKLFGKRKIEVRIDNYDTWSADHTLAVIIGPLLRSMKAKKQGIPGAFLSDEYNTLVSSEAFWAENGEGPLNTKATLLLDNASNKWEEALDHMIWAFEEYVKDDWDEQYWSGEHGKWDVEKTDKTYPNPITGVEEPTYRMLDTGTRTCDWDARKKHWDRVQEGIDLFAKNFQNLWT